MPTNYATKSDSKSATGVNTSNFSKIDLANLKSDINKSHIDKLGKVPSGLNSSKSQVGNLDVGKLKPVPNDLKKLSDAVNKEVLKKSKYNRDKQDLDEK